MDQAGDHAEERRGWICDTRRREWTGLGNGWTVGREEGGHHV